MRKIDTSVITTTAGLPGKAGVLNNIQQAHQEILAAICNNIAGNNYNTANVYILYGCVNTGSGLSYVLSAGAVFYNGEVYLMDAVSFVAPGGQVAVGNVVITNDTSAIGDPVQLTDGTSHNVLQIRKVVPSAAVSGSGGLPDYSTWISLGSSTAIRKLIATYGASQTIDFRQDQIIYYTTGLTSGTSTLTWDFNGAIPGVVVSLKLVMAGGTTLTIATPGGATIINLVGAPTASKTNYIDIEYMGKNDAGNDEVRYTVTSL